MKDALIFQGGWDGHKPAAFAALIAERLRPLGVTARIESSLDCLLDAPALRQLALIVPLWTMGALSEPQSKGLLAAVRGGVGLGGFHGGMGDAFRGNIEYEWMVGGHFVGHPHVGKYQVRLTDSRHPITQGVATSFEYHSEQYYMLMDPGVHVLAETTYLHEGQSVTMPVAWTKKWDGSRVFYSSLGHALGEFTEFPAALELTLRGLCWAAGEW